jgi:hypothetical protein
MEVVNEMGLRAALTQEVNDLFFDNQTKKEELKEFFEDRLQSIDLTKKHSSASFELFIVTKRETFTFLIEYTDIHLPHPTVFSITAYDENKTIGFWSIRRNPVEVMSMTGTNITEFVNSLKS